MIPRTETTNHRRSTAVQQDRRVPEVPPKAANRALLERLLGAAAQLHYPAQPGSAGDRFEESGRPRPV